MPAPPFNSLLSKIIEAFPFAFALKERSLAHEDYLHSKVFMLLSQDVSLSRQTQETCMSILELTHATIHLHNGLLDPSHEPKKYGTSTQNKQHILGGDYFFSRALSLIPTLNDPK